MYSILGLVVLDVISETSSLLMFWEWSSLDRQSVCRSKDIYRKSIVVESP